MNALPSLFCEDAKCTGESGKLCVRRVMGCAGFVTFGACVVLGIEHTQVYLLGILSAGLLGLTTLDKFSGGKTP
jgi:hypothetical protein